MKKLIITAAASFLMTAAIAQTNWKVDVSHSKLGFSVTHMMVAETEGRFKIFDGSASSKSDMDFTDAKIDTAGRFENAQNGTIFLDEIGNVPLHLQSKLLQVIQTKTVTRLGESKARPLNVRIITATNLNLKEEVNQKNFREDLYYRINTMEITLPSLKERKEDNSVLVI